MIFNLLPILLLHYLVVQSIDKFKYAYSVGDESGSNLIAHAYAKLKTESVLDGASDV